MNRIKNKFQIAFVCIFGGLFASCSDDTKVTAESSINYTIILSPDLLKFVTPQVSYADENGNLVTITGVEELDGKVIENEAGISVKSGGAEAYAGGWTKQVITGTGYKCWTFQMKFNRLNFHSFMGVKYLKNEFPEDTNGKSYDFHHSVNTSITSLKTTITEKNGLFNNSQSVDSKAYTDNHIITVR